MSRTGFTSLRELFGQGCPRWHGPCRKATRKANTQKVVASAFLQRGMRMGHVECSRKRKWRAKEAESLEQAKQTNDKDLKHLHETIARQWRRLAERIETGPANRSVGCASPEVPQNAQDASSSVAKTDAEQDAPRAARVETPLEWMMSCWFGGNLDGKSETHGSPSGLMCRRRRPPAPMR